MSEVIVEAERHLACCLEAMRDAIQLTLEDALPQSTLRDGEGGSAGSTTDAGVEEEGNMPDTLRQRLEWEHATESERVLRLAARVQQAVAALRHAVVGLGGGNPGAPLPAPGLTGAAGADTTPVVVDIPVAALDREIEWLNAECTRLGHAMVERYTEAQELARTLEAEIVEAKVPPL